MELINSTTPWKSTHAVHISCARSRVTSKVVQFTRISLQCAYYCAFVLARALTLLCEGWKDKARANLRWFLV